MRHSDKTRGFSIKISARPDKRKSKSSCRALTETLILEEAAEYVIEFEEATRYPRAEEEQQFRDKRKHTRQV